MSVDGILVSRVTHEMGSESSHSDNRSRSGQPSSRVTGRTSAQPSEKYDFWDVVLDTSAEVHPQGAQASEPAQPARGDSVGPSTPDHVGYQEAGASSTREETVHSPLPTRMTPAGRSTTFQENKCHMCSATFSHKSSLYRHVRSFHQREQSHKCTQCSNAFDDKTSLERHVQIAHERKRPFQCTDCAARFQQRAHLDGHWKTVHLKERPHKCDQCNAVFGQKPHLSRHIRTVHQKDRPFRCQQCDARFSERRSLVNHQRLKHNVDSTAADPK